MSEVSEIIKGLSRLMGDLHSERSMFEQLDPMFEKKLREIETIECAVSLLSSHAVISSKTAGDAQADIEYIYRTDPEFLLYKPEANTNWIELKSELSRLSTITEE